jgi:putative salt-induced outer membrane protein YdiY
MNAFLRFRRVSVRAVCAAALLGLCLARVAHASFGWRTSRLRPPGAKHLKKKEGWQGTVSLGYLASTGSVSSSNFDARLYLTDRDGPWANVLDYHFVQGSAGGTVDTSTRNAEWESSYSFTPSNYVFSYLDYYSNPFSGYAPRETAAIGYGRRLFHLASQEMNASVGVGMRHSVLVNQAARTSAIERVALGYRWQLNRLSHLSERISVARGTDDVFSGAITSLTAHVAGNFAISLSYTLEHNSNVLPGLANTDTYTSVSLIYTL